MMATVSFIARDPEPRSSEPDNVSMFEKKKIKSCPGSH